MTPGPPPKPAELKRRTGNPGKQKLPKPSNLIALPQVVESVPVSLGSVGAEMWQQCRARAPWVAESDKPTLLMLCEKWERRAELMARLSTEDDVLYTDKGYAYANPRVGMLSTVENEIGKLLGVLGFTPADRTRMGLAEVKARSKFEELRERQQRV